MAITNEAGDGTSWPTTVEMAENGDGTSSFWANHARKMLNRTAWLKAKADLLIGKYLGAFERHGIILADADTGGSGTPGAFTRGGPGGGPSVQTAAHASDPGNFFHLGFPVLPRGSVVTSVVVKSFGDIVAGTFHRPTYQIFRVPNDGTAVVALSVAELDAQDGTSWASATVVPTTIPITGGSFTVDEASTYVLRCTYAWCGSPGTSMTLVDLAVAGTT